MKYYQLSYDGSRERYPSLREDLTVLLCQNCGVTQIMQPVESTLVFATTDELMFNDVVRCVADNYEEAFGFVLTRIAKRKNSHLMIRAQQKDDESLDEGFEDMVERLKNEGKISEKVEVITFA